MYQDGEEGLAALIGLRLVHIGAAAYQESPFHLYETISYRGYPAYLQYAESVSSIPNSQPNRTVNLVLT